MLDRIHVYGAVVRPYQSSQVLAEIVREAWQLRAYYALRRATFVEEQRLFASSDRDEHDRWATPIAALGHVAGMPNEVIGVVRIYPARAGVWYGGRLAVAAGYRAQGKVGTLLIAAAVSTAHLWGCRRFLATVQLQNQRYFEQRHFRREADVQVSGEPHVLMEADLGRYPAALSPASGQEAHAA